MTLGDRIVIMKDGVVQQIGTPQEVYNHPVNLFVSGFIGTTTINYFDAKLQKKNDKYVVLVCGKEIELSEDKQANLQKNIVEEQNITLGVRPDHIVLTDDSGILCKVEVSEVM